MMVGYWKEKLGNLLFTVWCKWNWKYGEKKLSHIVIYYLFAILVRDEFEVIENI